MQLDKQSFLVCLSTKVFFDRFKYDEIESTGVKGFSFLARLVSYWPSLHERLCLDERWVRDSQGLDFSYMQNITIYGKLRRVRSVEE